MLAAGLIWVFVSVAYKSSGDMHTANDVIKRCLLEYGELFLFLLSAMTYINSLEVGYAVKSWMPFQNPVASPGAYAAPNAVVSMIVGRIVGTSRMSD